jgi:heme-degrading monooxygenase HmoA
MNRRRALQTVASAAAAPAIPAAAAAPIQLHVDLEVDPAREQEMLSSFQAQFRPAISRQPGFVEVKLLKLRSALAGPPPGNAGYRLLISFQTEEQRQKWVATAEHQRVWPLIERALRGAKYTAALYDTV